MKSLRLLLGFWLTAMTAQAQFTDHTSSMIEADLIVLTESQPTGESRVVQVWKGSPEGSMDVSSAASDKPSQEIRCFQWDDRLQSYYLQHQIPIKAPVMIVRYKKLLHILDQPDAQAHALPLLKWHLENLMIPSMAKLSARDLNSWDSESDLSFVLYPHDYYNWTVADQEVIQLANKVLYSGHSVILGLPKILISHGEDVSAYIHKKVMDLYQIIKKQKKPYVISNNKSEYLAEEDEFLKTYASIVEVIDTYPDEKTFLEQLLLYDLVVNCNQNINIPSLIRIIALSSLLDGKEDLEERLSFMEESINKWEKENEVRLEGTPEPEIKIPRYEELIGYFESRIDMCADPRIRELTDKRMLWTCSDASAFAKAERFEEGAISTSVFPNPTQGQFTIEAKLEMDAPVMLRVIDAAGREILHREMPQVSSQDQRVYRLEVDLTAQPEGMYQLVLLQHNKLHRERILIAP